MELETYFDRIGYAGPATPTTAVLGSLLRAHVLRVPFENLDVQLGRSTTVDPEAAFDKIVTGNRGGWCYEHNGLFGWVLSAIGFDVMRVAAAVMRAERGSIADSNHLTLLVRTERAVRRWQLPQEQGRWKIARAEAPPPLGQPVVDFESPGDEDWPLLRDRRVDD